MPATQILHNDLYTLPPGSTPLHVACLMGCLERVKLLLRAYVSQFVCVWVRVCVRGRCGVWAIVWVWHQALEADFVLGCPAKLSSAQLQPATHRPGPTPCPTNISTLHLTQLANTLTN